MELITMEQVEITKLKTGVELERKLNNEYSKLQTFTKTNLMKFNERCELNNTIILSYELLFYPTWDKVFEKKHPYTGLVKYKMLV